MGDSVKANKFHLFSSTVTNLLYQNAYLDYTYLKLNLCFLNTLIINQFIRLFGRISIFNVSIQNYMNKNIYF